MVEFFVHPQALCESQSVGAGTRVWAFAHVMSGAVIGRECNIGDHAFVEGGARIGDRVTLKNQVMVWDGVAIGDDVFVGPAVCFTNDRTPRSWRMRLPAVSRRGAERCRWLVETRVEQGASLGAGCVIVGGITIGAYAMIAAGAVVIRDVLPHALAVGTPARRTGWVCRCGERLQRSGPLWGCPRCGESFDEHDVGGCIGLARSC